MILAIWASRGGKWSAVLYKQKDGYRLSERKHGSECGASFMPSMLLANDEVAVEHFHRKVMTGFDVEMKRVGP